MEHLSYAVFVLHEYAMAIYPYIRCSLFQTHYSRCQYFKTPGVVGYVPRQHTYLLRFLRLKTLPDEYMYYILPPVISSDSENDIWLIVNTLTKQDKLQKCQKYVFNAKFIESWRLFWCLTCFYAYVCIGLLPINIMSMAWCEAAVTPVR